jgi:hexulose-6-phosphate isomerase
VDSIQSPHVRVHFDTANIAMFQHAEHWVPILGRRIQNVHLKEFNKRGTDCSLEAFPPLLDGTANWPTLMDAFDAIGYRGYLTFEYFHPCGALSRGVDLPDCRFAGPHPWTQALTP